MKKDGVKGGAFEGGSKAVGWLLVSKQMLEALFVEARQALGASDPKAPENEEKRRHPTKAETDAKEAGHGEKKRGSAS